jgi:mevalonate kinase
MLVYLLILFFIFLLLFFYLEYLWRNQIFVSEKDFLYSLIESNNEQKSKLLKILQQKHSKNFSENAQTLLKRIKTENRELKKLCAICSE